VNGLGVVSNKSPGTISLGKLGNSLDNEQKPTKIGLFKYS